MEPETVVVAVQAEKRAEAERLAEVMRRLDAFHERHGFMSDEFSDL